MLEKVGLLDKILDKIFRLENLQRLQAKVKSNSYEIVRVGTGKIDNIDIKECLVGTEAEALEKVVQMVREEKMMVVEVGSWKGMSTSVLAKTVADYHGSVFAVDHWMGGEKTWTSDVAKVVDIYSIFKRNMILLGFWDTIHPLVMDSQTASQIFADGILDLIFIDADHRYESVQKDILAWLPKLKDGGMLCGHDCEGYYSQYPEEIKKTIDEHLEDEFISGIGHHGVIKALHDCLQGKYSIMANSGVWYYIKDGTDKNY